MKISFIVPTYNSMKTIRNTIMSIKNHIDDPEIIVVDDNSNDDTVMIINDIGVDRLVRNRVNSGGPIKDVTSD